MALSDFLELYKMIDLLTNEGDGVQDFGVHDSRGEMWIRLKSGNIFTFTLNLEE